MPSGAKPEAEAAPEAVAAEGPASGGPEAGSASGGPVPSLEQPLERKRPFSWPLENGLLAYAFEFLQSNFIYYQDASRADRQRHYNKCKCGPLIVDKVKYQTGSPACTWFKRGWIPAIGEPVMIVDLFVGGLHDPPPLKWISLKIDPP